jgi:hypothetical protein
LKGKSLKDITHDRVSGSQSSGDSGEIRDEFAG